MLVGFKRFASQKWLYLSLNCSTRIESASNCVLMQLISIKRARESILALDPDDFDRLLPLAEIAAIFCAECCFLFFSSYRVKNRIFL